MKIQIFALGLWCAWDCIVPRFVCLLFFLLLNAVSKGTMVALQPFVLNYSELVELKLALSYTGAEKSIVSVFFG